MILVQFNFLSRTISFIKGKGAKEAIKEFSINSFVKLDRADDKELSLVVAGEKPYKKTVWFETEYDRGTWFHLRGRLCSHFSCIRVILRSGFFCHQER